MNIFESVPEAEFRQKVHRFAKEHVAPIAEKVEEGMFPRDILRKLGEKRFITNGGVADFLFVFAVTDPTKPPRSGVSAIVVPRETNGVQIVKTYGLLGMHGANVVHLRFRNVKVPGENLIGGLHRGFPILLDELDRERPA